MESMEKIPVSRSFPDDEKEFRLDREYSLILKVGEGQEASFKANCFRENGRLQCHINKDGHSLDFYQFGVDEYNPENDSYVVSLRSREPGQEDWIAKVEFSNPDRKVH